MNRLFFAIYLFMFCIFFSACKKDTEPEPAAQIGEWKAHQRIDLYKGVDFFKTEKNVDLEISIQEDESMEFVFANEVEKYEWDLIEDWNLMVLAGDTIAVTGDTVIIVKRFDIVTNENDYQEWFRRWEPGDTIPSVRVYAHETLTLQRNK